MTEKQLCAWSSLRAEKKNWSKFVKWPAKLVLKNGKGAQFLDDFVQFSITRFFVRSGRSTVHLICLGHKYIRWADCKVLGPDVYTIFLNILNFDTFLVKFSNFSPVSNSNDFLNLVKVILRSYCRFQKSDKKFFSLSYVESATKVALIYTTLRESTK